MLNKLWISGQILW